jgi:membrane-bound lytic murein transglycosylase B
MKKFLFPLFCAASFALTGCQQEVKSEKVKEKLEKKDYKVEVIAKAELEVRIQGVNWNVEVKEAIYATKEEKPQLLAFFCANIDDASKFVNENIAVFSAFADKYEVENAKSGSHNNVAYIGTETAIAVAGLTVK